MQGIQATISTLFSEEGSQYNLTHKEYIRYDETQREYVYTLAIEITSAAQKMITKIISRMMQYNFVFSSIVFDIDQENKVNIKEQLASQAI